MSGSLKRISKALLTVCVIIVTAAPSASFSQPVQQVSANAGGEWRYADLADVFGKAPIAMHARVATATRIKDVALPAAITRFYIEADVVALIRGSGGIPPRVSYVLDAPNDSRGRPPRLKKAEVLIAALPVPDRPGEIQLAGADAQLAWTPERDARVRSILTAIVARDAAPIVTGVGSAFHSAGSIPGEGETQVFLTTANGAPVSLSILRRPGQAPRWALALGEIVDEAAGPPARDTLPWYRLACFLPRTLPDAAVAELPATDAAVAREDYAFVIAELGVCERVRGPGAQT